RHGAVVFFYVPEAHRNQIIQDLKPHVTSPFESPIENVYALQQSEASDFINATGIHLSDYSLLRLQLVAITLARDAILEDYETKIGNALEVLRPIASDLKRGQVGAIRSKQILQSLGESLQHRITMTGQVEITEKPDLLWDNPSLEGLFKALDDDYEIKERFAALEAKITLISEITETAYHISGLQRSLRLEWYIVALILGEIALGLWAG
ncbi:MAG: RMD1 family protein, partial [Bdellovibrionales bacterium]|nr:RMD1 family protein [Bdellovibrionales bacterium]